MLGFVLKRTASREADQIVTLFTDERGKIDAVARSVKKIKSKNAANLEPFALVDVGITGSGELATLTTTSVVESYRNLRENLATLRAGQTVLTLVNALLPAATTEPTAFSYLVNFFRTVAERGGIAPAELDVTIFGLLAVFGFSPELTDCVVCGKPVTGDAHFSIANGGVVCAEHVAAVPGGDLVLLKATTISYLQTFLGHLPNVDLSNTSVLEEERVHELAFRFWAYHTGVKVADWK